jgi:predicted nucleotidyltransferase component of viral defense system
MNISKEHLFNLARSLNYDPFTLEKVILLLNLLVQIAEHHYLQDKLVLKGGTALNLFHFNLPRLSVDIDLNYIGSTNRNIMQNERGQIERALIAICEREGYAIRRMPTEHAGGKLSIGYISTLGGRGNLSIDLNFIFRVTLWPIVKKHCYHLSPFTAENIATLDIHELAAGKLAALLSRCASRDLFDAYHLFTQQTFDMDKLRLAFVVYGGIDRKD